MTKQISGENVGVSCEMVVKNGNKILMGKRGKVFGEGSWAFPGGHLEKGEAAEDCARRELKEEVGINPVKMELLGIINDIPNISGQMRQYLRFIFLIEGYTGEVVNNEPDKCDGWEWFDLDNLPKPVFVGHVKVLKFFLSDRKNFFTEE